MGQQHRRQQVARQEAEPFVKLHTALAHRPELNSARKLMLSIIIDKSRMMGFCWCSWLTLGKDYGLKGTSQSIRVNARRMVRSMAEQFPGLVTIEKSDGKNGYPRSTNRLRVFLETLDPHGFDPDLSALAAELNARRELAETIGGRLLLTGSADGSACASISGTEGGGDRSAGASGPEAHALQGGEAQAPPYQSIRSDDSTDAGSLPQPGVPGSGPQEQAGGVPPAEYAFVPWSPPETDVSLARAVIDAAERGHINAFLSRATGRRVQILKVMEMGPAGVYLITVESDGRRASIPVKPERLPDVLFGRLEPRSGEKPDAQ